MPSFSPSFSSRLAVAAGTGALLVLIVVSITGGFTFDAGPLHVSARRVAGPLIILIAAIATLAVHGRAKMVASAASVAEFLESHATAVALIIAAAAAGAGIAYGTYAAAGADASGYISQAELLTAARLVQDEPLARQGAWIEGTWTFAPLGYRPGVVSGQLVPTYASGLPLTMAAMWIGVGEIGPYLIAPFLGALAVLCTYALGAKLHSRSAGVAAAALLASSPIFLFQIVQPMSDVPVTAWWTLSMLLALATWRPVKGRPTSATGRPTSADGGPAKGWPASILAVAAGIAAGMALLTRPNLLPLIIPAALATVAPLSAVTPTLAFRRIGLFLAGVMPAVAGMFLLQQILYGSPLASGYGRFSELFAFASIAPNLEGYAARLIAGEWPALSIALGSLLVLVVTRRREWAVSLRSIVPLWACVLIAVLLCYLPYAVFAEWAYLRFLLPALPLTFVLAAALLMTAMRPLPPALRGIVALALVTAACSMNVVHASREQAFNLRRYDARYRTTGRYLDAMLPQGAVVLAVQQSGSIRHYAHVPIVRWDMLHSDLDGTLAALRALGRHPFLLIEDWEKPDFASRFPASRLARLDWLPRADIGEGTRALLFDPADRDGAAGARLPDRVH